jgi:hypothetical protein
LEVGQGEIDRSSEQSGQLQTIALAAVVIALLR